MLSCHLQSGLLIQFVQSMFSPPVCCSCIRLVLTSTYFFFLLLYICLIFKPFVKLGQVLSDEPAIDLRTLLRRLFTGWVWAGLKLKGTINALSGTGLSHVSQLWLLLPAMLGGQCEMNEDWETVRFEQSRWYTLGRGWEGERGRWSGRVSSQFWTSSTRYNFM